MERDVMVVEALAAWAALKRRDPEDLSPYFMSAFTLEALGRYREAAAEWHYVISWLDAHTRTPCTAPGQRKARRIEAKLAAADADADGTDN